MTGQPMTTVYPALPAQPFASLAVTVKMFVPVTVGVPLITPVFVLRFSPTGSKPLVTVNVLIPIPPLAVFVAR